MTAAEILDRLLDELGDLKCPRGHKDFVAHNIAGCRACHVLDQVVDLYMKAEDERDRARLIFGAAA